MHIIYMHIYSYIHTCILHTCPSIIHQVKLTDALISGVNFAQAKDAELGWVDGQIYMNDEVDGIPILDILSQPQVRSWSVMS